ncbi:uncharacterized protein NPIL_466251 [Nephila pilipes]|uniref:Uncharacterized protein n=1 Tax=Nephila pilipes TaxID=299642 RepID=A0A8X6M8Q1_NEPPI|nr:uncharacterized protein NPIL_466251 [Nephila pilipes]
MDVYCSIRNTTPSVKKTNPSKPYAPKSNSPDSRFDKTNQANSTSLFSSGVTKLRCPNCKPTANQDSANFSNISWHPCCSTPNPSVVLKLAVNCTWGTACAGTGASHSIAGETLYLLLQREGVNFQKSRFCMSLADGHKYEVEVYITSVVIRLEGRFNRTPLTALPYAKGNRTLLGSWDYSEHETP